jgi:hypothetical protein
MFCSKTEHMFDLDQYPWVIFLVGFIGATALMYSYLKVLQYYNWFDHDHDDYAESVDYIIPLLMN